MVKNENTKLIINIYQDQKKIIDKRLSDFRLIWKEKEEDKILKELIFCLCTPQSKAVNCWKAVELLFNENNFYKINKENITKTIKGLVRFHNYKSNYVISVRDEFTENGEIKLLSAISKIKNEFFLREWLTKTIKGLGFKEASHFLRNIGRSTNLAILDRHILKNLVSSEVIKEIPKYLNKKNYMKIEEKMKNFANKIKIPLNALDLILWYKETGKFFK